MFFCFFYAYYLTILYITDQLTISAITCISSHVRCLPLHSVTFANNLSPHFSLTTFSVNSLYAIPSAFGSSPSFSRSLNTALPSQFRFSLPPFYLHFLGIRHPERLLNTNSIIGYEYVCPDS